jgi:hypothetical protein
MESEARSPNLLLDVSYVAAFSLAPPPWRRALTRDATQSHMKRCNGTSVSVRLSARNPDVYQRAVETLMRGRGFSASVALFQVLPQSGADAP